MAGPHVFRHYVYCDPCGDPSGSLLGFQLHQNATVHDFRSILMEDDPPQFKGKRLTRSFVRLYKSKDALVRDDCLDPQDS